MSDSGNKIDALIVGLDPVYLDLVFSGLPEVPKPGQEIFAEDFAILPGGVFNVAATLARLGVGVGLAADIDAGLVGDFVMSKVRDAGIDASLLRRQEHGGRAITVSYSLGGERSFLSFKDPYAEWPELYELYERTRPKALLCPGFPGIGDREEVVEALSRIGRDGRCSIFIDASHNRVTLDEEKVARAVSLADVFFCNEAECLQLTGAESWQEGADRLLAFTGQVVVKLGAEGAAYMSHEESCIEPAPDVDVVDTTGAGDCFVAGFVFGMLRGMSSRDCLRAAVFQGSSSVRAAGGTTSIMDAEQLLRALGE